MNLSTERKRTRKQLAAIYRKAALNAEANHCYGSSCHEIHRLVSFNTMAERYGPEVIAFRNLFSPHGQDTTRAFWLNDYDRWDQGEQQNWRPLALCFMAAMVEAGDA